MHLQRLIVACFLFMCGLIVDDKAWQTNEEFAREYLAGFNPIQIELVKVGIIPNFIPGLVLHKVLQDLSRCRIQE